MEPDLSTSTAVLISSAFGDGARVREVGLVREGPRSRVYRVEWKTEASAGTAILKQITDDGECGFTEWASLELLTGCGPDGVAPRFLAGSREGRCFLMEDLGPSQSLDAVLLGADSEAVRKVCVRLAETYARMHAAGGATGEATGEAKEAAFKRLRSELPAARAFGRHVEARRWRNASPKLEEWASVLSMELPRGFAAALDRIVAAYSEPGRWLAFTHGDPAPTNNQVIGDSVRLLDFEYGGFRHALYDLTAWYILCPLPEHLVTAMQSSYSQELAAGGWETSDIATDTGWADMCAYRALAMLTWISPTLLAADRPWAGEWTAREALITALHRLELAAEPGPHLAPVAAYAAQLLECLSTRWPECRHSLPPWPALAQ